ncbi:MAG: hypothetical protein HY660_05140 [Armatimonadetes bacterium]|nr:hypothetical protein [Armatimonadota bacterium]
MDQVAELQALDSRLAALQKRRRALDDGAGLHTTLVQARQAWEQARTGLHATEVQVRTWELEVESLAAKRKKFEQDLYGGRITNPKELESLQAEVNALKRAISRIEDQILGGMETIERERPEVVALEQSAKGQDEALAAHVEAYRQEVAAIDAEQAELAARREAMAAEIDELLLRKYERIRARAGGIAVVRVEHDRCGGCHVALPEGMLVRVREGDDLVTCEECGRILRPARV